jgi:hypothetical protein
MTDRRTPMKLAMITGNSGNDVVVRRVRPGVKP